MWVVSDAATNLPQYSFTLGSLDAAEVADNFYTDMNMNEWYPLYSRFRVVGKLRFPHQDDSFYPKDHVSNKHEHHHLFPLIGHSSNYSRLNLTRYGTAI